MFGVVLKVIWSNLEESSLLAVCAKKAGTNPLGFLWKFQICSNFLYR